jgi:hypothetical protein
MLEDTRSGPEPVNIPIRVGATPIPLPMVEWDRAPLAARVAFDAEALAPRKRHITTGLAVSVTTATRGASAR